jgi:hypothetical protein
MRMAPTQWAPQRAGGDEVVGSNPILGSIKKVQYKDPEFKVKLTLKTTSWGV